MIIVDNLIKEAKANWFSGLNNLEVLGFVGCNIRKIDIVVISCLQSLKKLNLSQNPIKQIKSNLFFRLNNLEELFLYKCEIERIEGGAFNGLQSLKMLNLAKNIIKDLEANSFYGLNMTVDIPTVLDYQSRMYLYYDFFKTL